LQIAANHGQNLIHPNSYERKKNAASHCNF
jgi:hypothetical protein